jgi:hypothetical protein
MTDNWEERLGGAVLDQRTAASRARPTAPARAPPGRRSGVLGLRDVQYHGDKVEGDGDRARQVEEQSSRPVDEDLYAASG